MEPSLLKPFVSRLLTVLLISSSLAVIASSEVANSATLYDADGETLKFSSSQVVPQSAVNSTSSDTGVRAPKGTSVLYTNVVSLGGQNIDARVKIVEALNIEASDDVNGVSQTSICEAMEELDDHSSTPSREDFLQPEIDIDTDCDSDGNGSSFGYAEIYIEFLKGGTDDAVVLENVTISVYDVDDNQFVDFSGIASYNLSSDTILTPTETPANSGNWRFSEDNGVSTSTSVDSYTKSRVTVKYDTLSQITLKMGATANGNANFEFDFSAGELWLDGTSTDVRRTEVQPPARTFDIDYDPNGAQGSAPAATSGTGVVTLASATSLTKPGYNFASWNTEPDGSGVSVAAGGSFAPTDDVVMYANWVAPVAYEGPIVRDVGADGSSVPFVTSSSQEVRVDGERLSSVTSVFVEDKEGTVVSTADDHFVMITPENLSVGIHDLVVRSSIGNLRFLRGFEVTEGSANFSAANAVCDGVEPSWWTQRISDTQAKAYIKCPAVGEKYRILQQTGGSGSYDSIFVKTLTDENDTTQVFNEFGRYIVRTIDLEDINRIRITVDDVELWKVRYNNPPSGLVTY